MPSNKSLVLIALMAIVGWLASTSMYVVSEQQRGIQTRLDHIINDDLAPGLHLKLPIVDKYTLFDARLRSTVLSAHSFTLASHQELRADLVAAWRVVSPVTYARATQGDESRAVHALAQSTAAQLSSQMSHLALADLSVARQKEALQAVRQALDARMRDTLGIAVENLAFRSITLPDAQQRDVVQNMVTALSNEAAASKANGEEQAGQIREDTERQKTMIMATANENAAAMKGQVDADIAELYNDAYERNPAFFRFYQGLKSWREGMQEGNGVLVLGPNDTLMRWINLGR